MNAIERFARWAILAPLATALLPPAFFFTAMPVTAVRAAGQEQLFVAVPGDLAVGAYTLTGGTVNPALVTGLNIPYDEVVVGNDLYVVNFGNGMAGAGTVGRYNAISGAPIDLSFITGLNGPVSLAASGGALYVSNFVGGTVGKYDATTGTAINSSLVLGLIDPFGVAVSGNELYVVNQGNGGPGSNTIKTFDASNGALHNPAFVSGLNVPADIAVSGGYLYVVNNAINHATLTDGIGTVGKYDAATGATVNASLISNLSSPVGVALSGNDLFVSNSYDFSQGIDFNQGTVGEYDATNGAALNPSLITGLNVPLGLAIGTVPEARQWLMVGAVAMGAMGVNWARRRTRDRVEFPYPMTASSLAARRP
ncbi:MAG TPA: hypothetical protein VGM76_18055 [Lacipirellulaceae bacterium]|jgi:hypothetical protein